MLESDVKEIFSRYREIAPHISGEFYKKEDESKRTETWPSGIFIYDVLCKDGIEKGVLVMPCPDKYHAKRLEVALYENVQALDANTPTTHYTLTSEGQIFREGVNAEADDITGFLAQALDNLPKTLATTSQQVPMHETTLAKNIVGIAGIGIALVSAYVLISRMYVRRFFDGVFR